LTLSAALPDAALRVMRTAAGRRALHVVLLVGGLFALGFLCGEQAHAADGAVPTTGQVVQSATSALGQVVEPKAPVKSPVKQGASTPEAGSIPSKTVKHVTNTARHTVRDVVRPAADKVVPRAVGDVVRPAADDVVPPAADDVVQTPADDVVRPIGDLVKTVTGGLVGAPSEGLPTLPSLPSAPSLLSLPSLPSVPSLSGLPAIPGVGGQTPPAGSAPQQSGGAVEQPGPGAGHGAGQLRSDVAAASSYGPGVVVDRGGAEAGRDHDGVRAGQAPAHQAPPGDPTGALGNQSAVDNGAPRYGDPHAVNPNHRAPLRLVPGAFAVVTAAETRDRYRDIPVFPG